MSVAFDTLKLADRLAAGGFTGEQAKTAAAALSEAPTDTVVIKGSGSSDRPTRPCDRKLRPDIGALELRMTVKLGAMLAVAVGATGVLLKIFH